MARTRYVDPDGIDDPWSPAWLDEAVHAGRPGAGEPGNSRAPDRRDAFVDATADDAPWQ